MSYRSRDFVGGGVSGGSQFLPGGPGPICDIKAVFSRTGGQGIILQRECSCRGEGSSGGVKL